MTTNITITFLLALFVDPVSGDKYWTRQPMQGQEACEIAASMLWDNVRDIRCIDETYAVTRPKPRPAMKGN